MDVGELGPVHVCCGAYPEHRDYCPEAAPAKTGHVISTPPRKHECSPGWATKTVADGTHYGIPPLATDYPRGTVWECSCGQAWVSRGRTGAGSNTPWWRRQSRIAEAVRTWYWRFRPATSR